MLQIFFEHLIGIDKRNFQQFYAVHIEQQNKPFSAQSLSFCHQSTEAYRSFPGISFDTVDVQGMVTKSWQDGKSKAMGQSIHVDGSKVQHTL